MDSQGLREDLVVIADRLNVAIAVLGLCVMCGITAYEMRSPETVVKTVQSCSPRSVDNYSPTELRRMAAQRERLSKVK